jgi:hypothetical protein
MDSGGARYFVDEVLRLDPADSGEVWWDPQKGWTAEQQRTIHARCTRPIPVGKAQCCFPLALRGACCSSPRRLLSPLVTAVLRLQMKLVIVVDQVVRQVSAARLC